MKTLAWVTPWNRICGIADYAQGLWPHIEAGLEAQGLKGVVVSLDEFRTRRALTRRLRELRPDIVHFQHEYSFYGGVAAYRYYFPRLVRRLKLDNPAGIHIATAHTILAPTAIMTSRKPGLYGMARWVAKVALFKTFGDLFNPYEWRSPDGVVVHSTVMNEFAKFWGARSTHIIPHYIPASSARFAARRGSSRTLLLFGFFTPNKGQDLAIRALAQLPADVRLILAGGISHEEQRSYRDSCLALIEELGLRDRVDVTGYVEPADFDGLFAQADLVVAPFRQTTGSGTLANALARGAAVLASDHPVNRSLDSEEPGTLAFFRIDDPADLAEQANALLQDSQRTATMRAAALRYAERHSVSAMAERHLAFYRRLLATAS